MAHALLVLGGLMLALAPLAAAPAPEKAAGEASQSRLICKKFPETGSLVKKVRVCKTTAEWEANRMLLRQRDGVNSCALQPCDVGGK